MATPISYRPSESEQQILRRLDEESPTRAIRQALEIANQVLDDRALAAEGERVAADATDRDEKAAITEYMGDLTWEIGSEQ
jgi:hypothetical protein